MEKINKPQRIQIGKNLIENEDLNGYTITSKSLTSTYPTPSKGKFFCFAKNLELGVSLYLKFIYYIKFIFKYLIYLKFPYILNILYLIQSSYLIPKKI
jgi:hypothetical protein